MRETEETSATLRRRFGLMAMQEKLSAGEETAKECKE